MRCKKLRAGGLKVSLEHTHRERDTPNADPERTPSNEQLIGPKSSDAAMGAFRDHWPEKQRKNGVMAVEYLMTTSPEWAASATPEQQRDFFAKSLDFLKEKYGEQNIVSATVHNDEMTPHLAAYIVPKKPDGKMSARHYLNGSLQLKKDQDDFAKKVEHLGLERGITGSKAKHQRVQQHYTNINKSMGPIQVGVQIDDLRPRHDPKMGFEEPDKMAKRITSEQVERLSPQIAPIVARARETDELLKKNKALAQQVKMYQKDAIDFQTLKANITPEEQVKLDNALSNIKIKQQLDQEQQVKPKPKIKPKGPKLGM